MKKTRQQYFKLSKDMTRNFSKRKYSQQGLHEKIFIWLLVKEMKIKNTTRYHIAPLWMAIIKIQEMPNSLKAKDIQYLDFFYFFFSNSLYRLVLTFSLDNLFSLLFTFRVFKYILDINPLFGILLTMLISHSLRIIFTWLFPWLYRFYEGPFVNC